MSGTKGRSGSKRESAGRPKGSLTRAKAGSSAYVYAIVVDDVVRYVGKGRDKRLYIHVIEARRSAARCGARTSHLHPRVHRKLVEAIRAGSDIAEIVILDGLTDQTAFRLEYESHWQFSPELARPVVEHHRRTVYGPTVSTRDWHNPENPLYKAARPVST